MRKDMKVIDHTEVVKGSIVCLLAQTEGYVPAA